MKTAKKKPAPPAKKPIVTVQKMIELSALEPSPLNPRKTIGDISDVRDSMASVGLAQPILVRPHPKKRGRFEIVCGHRRFAAAKALKWKELACAVRDLTDREAIEVMLVENTARADVPPLEEAEAYAALHAPPHSLPVEEIAARVAKSTAHVYQRIRLAEKLCSDGKKALADGKMRLGAALVLIRLEDQKEQKEALQSMRMHKDSPAEARDAQWVVSRHLRVIGDARFDVGDGSLVAAAGACSGCPKRSDKQPLLFAGELSGLTGTYNDDKRARCMDGGCWTKKEEAHQARVIAKAKEDGAEVLKGDKAKKVLPYGPRNSPARGWVRLDDKNPGGRATWGDALKKTPEAVKATVAVVDGQAVELVPEKEARAAARPAGLAWAKAPTPAAGAASSSHGVDPQARKAAREAEKLENATWDRTVRELSEGIRVYPAVSDRVLVHVLRLALVHALEQPWGFIDPALRRGFTHPEIAKRNRKVADEAVEHVEAWAQRQERTGVELLALLFERYIENEEEDLAALAKLVGVKLDGIEERARADLAAAAEAKRNAKMAEALRPKDEGQEDGASDDDDGGLDGEGFAEELDEAAE